MPQNSGNIIQGAATVFLNGVDLGFTQGGQMVRNEREYSDIIADQAVGTVKKFRNMEKMFVKISLLEVTLELLRIAWDQPVSNYAGGRYYLGYGDSCSINTHALRLAGKSPGCGNREFVFYECISHTNVEYQMQRDNPTVLEVEFEVLKSSANGNFFGYVRDF